MLNISFVKALDIPIEAITELRSASSINIRPRTINGSTLGNSNHNINRSTFNLTDKVAELYERQIKARGRFILHLIKRPFNIYIQKSTLLFS